MSNIRPFDSFTNLLNILTGLGYYPLDKPKYRILGYLHQLYRVLVFILSIMFNVQQWIFIVMIQDQEKSFAGLIVEIPQINLIMKALAIIFGIGRLQRLQELMNDPLFAANSEADEECLKRNQDGFRRLLNAVMTAATFNFTAWTFTTVLERLRNHGTTMSTYIPFETNTTLRFSLAVVIQHSPAIWIGYGQLALDILIACYYSQAVVQLKIIKQNLTCIFDCDDDTKNGLRIKNTPYIDQVDDKANEKFVFYVQRYEKVVWYVNEVNRVFNKAISVQFYATSAVICLVIYRLSITPVASVSFMFLVTSLFLLQCQVFLYCYYGEQVKYESSFVSDSLYLSEWVSLSPRFRRQLLIAMARWLTPITPRVSAIVPLSLTTYIMIIRAAFNLFAVLKTTNSVTN